MLCEIITPNFAQFTAGIDEVLGTEGYMAFIGNAAEDATRQREVLLRMQEHGVDGLVVVASENTRADALEEGACARMPCVLAQRRVEGFPADYVGPDYGAGMELITEHLIALGPSATSPSSAACAASRRSPSAWPASTAPCAATS